jgi:hypothetical protein
MSTLTNREQVVNGHVYRIDFASAFELGLFCDGKGVRTWWANSFAVPDDPNSGVEFPDISHPKIQEAIRIHENFLAEFDV